MSPRKFNNGGIPFSLVRLRMQVNSPLGVAACFIARLIAVNVFLEALYVLYPPPYDIAPMLDFNFKGSNSAPDQAMKAP